MPRNASQIRTKTQKILQSLSVERQDFGNHWDEIKDSRYEGTLSDDGFEKMCMFVLIVKECGLPANELSRRQMSKPLLWRFSAIKGKTRKLCAKRVRKLIANRQGVADHNPSSDDEEAEDRAHRPDDAAGDPDEEQTSRSVTPTNGLWHPPMAAVSENPPENDDASTYEHWLGPENTPLREPPANGQNEALLQFATGRALFPTDLLEASAGERRDFDDAVVRLDKEASVAQVPASIPEPYRTACVERIRSCNPRLKPSSQECYESIIRCSKEKLPFHLTDLVAMFAFLHYCIGETGRNRWLWQKMKVAGAEMFCDPEYEWNIVDGVVEDGQGQSLANLVTTQAPPSRRRHKGRS